MTFLASALYCDIWLLRFFMLYYILKCAFFSNVALAFVHDLSNLYLGTLMSMFKMSSLTDLPTLQQNHTLISSTSFCNLGLRFQSFFMRLFILFNGFHFTQVPVHTLLSPHLTTAVFLFMTPAMVWCERGIQVLLATVGAFAAFALMTVAIGTDYWLYARAFICNSTANSSQDDPHNKDKKDPGALTHSGLWRICCLEGK